jgi:hypothetical protein
VLIVAPHGVTLRLAARYRAKMLGHDWLATTEMDLNLTDEEFLNKW